MNSEAPCPQTSNSSKSLNAICSAWCVLDVFIATLKTNPCFESKINVCYGVAMFKSLLLISCLGFVVGCGDESEKVWFGDATENDLNRLIAGRYTKITGRLIITGSPKKAIDLPQLRSVDGGVIIKKSHSLTTISMPHLKTIGGPLVISSSHGLTSISFPQLETIGGRVEISNNDTLTTLTLPQLQSVGGGVDLSESPLLTDCDLGSYTEQHCPQ